MGSMFSSFYTGQIEWCIYGKPAMVLSCLFNNYFMIDPIPSTPLPAMGGDAETFAMLGISGGSYMTTNMHVIHSDIIKGAGLVIGGPYNY